VQLLQWNRTVCAGSNGRTSSLHSADSSACHLPGNHQLHDNTGLLFSCRFFCVCLLLAL